MSLESHGTFLFNNPENKEEIEKDSPSNQMAHQAKPYPYPSGCQIFFSDNFYTCHHLAHALWVMTDDEARMFNTLSSGSHKPLLVHIFKEEWGSWCLVRACDEHPELAQVKHQHQHHLLIFDMLIF